MFAVFHPTRHLLLGSLAGLLLISSPAIARAQDDDDQPTRREQFRWAGQVAAGQAIEIRGVNGPVKAEPSTSGQVEVVATKSGRRNDPRGVRIEVVPHAQGVTICAVYPEVDGEANECHPGGGGRNNTRNNDVKVEFAVRVPAGVNFAARTVNGGVEAHGLTGRVDINTVNGSVVFNTEGSGAAQTVNGSITGKLGRADWSETLELQTVNGSITLDLPSSTNADVQAQTVNGRINSDLPLTVTQLSRRSLKGTIGAGGRGLSLQTVNGSITLKSGA